MKMLRDIVERNQDLPELSHFNVFKLLQDKTDENLQKKITHRVRYILLAILGYIPALICMEENQNLIRIKQAVVDSELHKLCKQVQHLSLQGHRRAGSVLL